MLKIKPLRDRVLVKRSDAEEKTASGIFIPDNAQEKPSQGVVLAVGAGRLLDNGTEVTPLVKEGDTVIFSKYTGTEVTIDNESVLIMKEDDIFGVIS